jgi:hypothetical protein
MHTLGRGCWIAAIIAGLIVAPMAAAEPLAPGKPAGVHQAARKNTRAGLLIAGGLLAGGIAALVIFGGSDNNNGVLNTGTSTGATS